MGQSEVVGPEDNAISINSSSKEAAKDLPEQDANNGWWEVIETGDQHKKALEELKGEFDTLMYTYLQKLHNAFHEDNGLEVSHEVIVNKIKQDCMSIFQINLEISYLTNVVKMRSSKKSWNTILTWLILNIWKKSKV